jgi:hypothetical protein
VSSVLPTDLAAGIKKRSYRLALRPRCQHDARELRVCCTVAAPARHGCEGAKECTLHHQRWRTQHDCVAELPRCKGEL